MKKFRSLKQLKHFLKSKIKASLQTNVPPVVTELMQTNILTEVYLKYSPKIYERRGNDGGLMDDENIIWNKRSETGIEIYNVAKRNVNYTNEYLAPVIEFGHRKAKDKGYRGYSYPYPQYAYYYPRPFIKKTRIDLKKKKHHVKAIQDGLKSYGIYSVHSRRRG